MVTKEDDVKKSAEILTGKKIAFSVSSLVWVPTSIGVALGTTFAYDYLNQFASRTKCFEGRLLRSAKLSREVYV